jgi:hypothetical protein
VIAVALDDAALDLGVALVLAVPSTIAAVAGLRGLRRVEQDVVPTLRAVDRAVNNELPDDPSLRQTAEATHDIAEVLREQEAGRVSERAEADKDSSGVEEPGAGVDGVT